MKYYFDFRKAGKTNIKVIKYIIHNIHFNFGDGVQSRTHNNIAN